MRTKAAVTVLLTIVLLALCAVPGAALEHPPWESIYCETIQTVCEEDATRIDIALLDLNFDGISELHIMEGGVISNIWTIKNSRAMEFHLDNKNNIFLPENYSAYLHKTDETVHWMMYGSSGMHFNSNAGPYENNAEVYGIYEYRFDFDNLLISCNALLERAYRSGRFIGLSDIVFLLNGNRVSEARLVKADQEWWNTFEVIPELRLFDSWKTWWASDGDFEAWFHEVVSQYQPTKYEPDDLAVAPADLSPLSFPWAVVGLTGGAVLVVAGAAIFILLKRRAKRRAG